MITAEQATVGAKATKIWFAYVNGKMLRGKKGVGRRFKTKAAAEKAAAALLNTHVWEQLNH